MLIGGSALELGAVSISYYALLVVVAIGAGGGIAWERAHDQEDAPDILLAMASLGLLLGVAVGRLFFVLNPPPSVAAYYDRAWFLAHPLDLQAGLLAVWNGGLGQAGLAIGGLLALGCVIWRRQLDVALWADRIMPGVLAGLVIAPLGSLLAGQMFGPVTRLPWGVSLEQRIPPYDDLTRFPVGTRFQPTPLYLALLAAAILVALLVVERRGSAWLRPGELALAGWGLYGVGAFGLGFWQVDVSRAWLGLSGWQSLALLMAAVCLVSLIWLRRDARRERHKDYNR